MRSALLFATLLWLPMAACLPPPGATSETDDEEALPEEVNWSRYEDFDPAPYQEEGPEVAEEAEVEHDVPEQLLAGSADAGVERTVQGFRVQVLSTRDRSAADEAVTDVEQWWGSNAEAAPEGLFSSAEDLPIYTVYRQPYYRVRVGNFTSRKAAERALAFLQQRYGDAFIAPGDVTVTR